MSLQSETLSSPEVRALARTILESGQIRYSKHAKEEMAKDRLSVQDVVNVVRAGVVANAAECENGSWRWRFWTQKIVVIVAFRSERELRVVTAWRVGG
jgi:Domain of unknown function (DUF4258)